jgi:hypothetical protein
MIRVTWTVVAVLLAGAARAADGVPPPAPIPASKPSSSAVKYLQKKMARVARLWKEAGRAARRLPSRVFAVCVSKGMMEEQVTRILGKPDIQYGGLVGGILLATWIYPDLGVSVQYDNLDPCTGQPTDTLRVRKVICHGALWD